MTRRLVLDLRDRRPAWSIPAWAVAEIRAELPPGWELVEVAGAADGRGDGGAPSAKTREAVRGAEVYAGWGVPDGVLRAAADDGAGLRWVHSASAGVGSSLGPEMLRSPVVLTNSAGVYAEPIAETVVAALLFFARGFDFAVRAQAERRWDASPFQGTDTPVRELAGSVVGILGLGGIGRAVARRSAVLGTRVLALRRGDAEPPAGLELLRGPDALPRLLAASDALVIALPETEATRGMIGAAQLALLRPGAVLVNVGRGAVVDEAALAEALRSGGLRGAALDVFAREPLPADSPLWTLSNVLVLPHVSGTSARFWRRQTDLLVDNLRRFLSGRPLRNVVRKDAGY